MASRLNPYLGFSNQAREAMEFYRSVFGGDLKVTTYGEGGMAQNPADAAKVMHAQLETPADFTLMASDAPEGMERSAGSSITVSLSGDDHGALRGYWDGLSEGATIVQPLEQAPWGDHFGMLTDRFGTPWMFNITGQTS